MIAPRTQRNLAILGALALVAIFLGANARLVAVAVQSQPACVENAASAMPARRSC